MSETLTHINPDLAAVNEAQAAHEAGFAVTDHRAIPGTTISLRGDVTFPTEVQQAPESPAASEAEEPATAPVETATELLNPDRALARLGNRLGSFANRRTTKQVLGEKKGAAHDYTTEKAEAAKTGAKKVATKVGAATLLSIDSVLETAARVGSSVYEKKDALKANLTEKRDAARSRKDDRLTARAEKRAETDMLKEAYADDKAFDKNVKQTDRRARRAENKTHRAETRAELADKAKRTAKFAGKAALLAGVGVAAIPVAAGYGAYKGGKLGAEVAAKGARKTIEVAQDTGEAVKVNVTRGAEATKKRARSAQGTYHTKRADLLYDTSEWLSDKSKKLYAKHEDQWTKVEKLENKK